MNRGRFITVEGLEGTGKSTNLTLIETLIRKHGHNVLATREPGGTRTGEKVRAILLDKEEREMTAMTELLLMYAARRQHVEEVIEPALASGTWVISDRFTDSSYAYQGGGRQLGSKRVADLDSYVLGDFVPDLTIVLDLDISTGLARATKGGVADRFEREQQEFFERVRHVFLERGRGDRYRIIDTGRAIDQVQTELIAIIERFCSEA